MTALERRVQDLEDNLEQLRRTVQKLERRVHDLEIDED